MTIFSHRTERRDRSEGCRENFSKRPDQVQESAADASLMRVALAVIDAKEREALECDLKKLLASCE